MITGWHIRRWPTEIIKSPLPCCKDFRKAALVVFVCTLCFDKINIRIRN